MKRFWDEALDNIDEKYINETAQALARSENDTEEIHSPIAMKPAPAPKKSRKGLFIGIGSAAAVVALGIFGGKLLIDRGILPIDPVTSGISSDTSFTGDIVTDDNGNIVYSEDFVEGHIEFQQLVEEADTPNDARETDFGGASETEIKQYIEKFSGVNYLHIDNALSADRFKGDTSDFRRSFDGAEDREIQHATLNYTHENGAAVMVNLRQDMGGKDYLTLPDGGRLMYDVKRPFNSWLLDKKGEKIPLYVGGRMIDGVPYYSAYLELEYNGTIYCDVTAKGCSIENITDVLAGVVCGSEELTSAYSGMEQRFDPTQYSTFHMTVPEVYSMELEGFMTERLTEVFNKYEETGNAQFNLDFTQATEATLCVNTEDDPSRLLMLSVGTAGDKHYYSLHGTSAHTYYEISQEFYDELWSWFVSYTPHVVDAVVEEVYGGGSYVADGISITTDIPLQVGDDVRLTYYGDMMLTYPMQVRQISVEKIYNARKDDSPIWDDIPDGFDWEIFNAYFSKKWAPEGSDDYFVWSLFSDNYNPTHGMPLACYEDEAGYYVYGMDMASPCGYYINKTDLNRMYFYEFLNTEEVDGEFVHNVKRSEYALCYEYQDDSNAGDVPVGVLSKTGLRRFLDLMGEDFESFYFDVTNNDYVEPDGTVWYRDLHDWVGWGNIIVNSFTDDHAEVAARYFDEENDRKVQNGDTDLIEQYILFSLRKLDGQWTLESAVLCDELGEPLEDTFTHELTENYDDYDVTLRYNLVDIQDETEVQDIELFCTTSDGKTISARFSNMMTSGAPNDGTFTIPVGTVIETQRLELSDGDLFIAYVPVRTDGQLRYFSSIYTCSDSELEFISAGSTELIRPTAVENTAYGDNIVTFCGEESARSVRVDFESHLLQKATPPTDVNAVKTVTADRSKAAMDGSGMSVYVSYFHGEWGNGDGYFDLRLASDDAFSLDAPCKGFFMDESGAYMYGDSEMWFISKDDNDTLYYFEDAADGAEMELSGCTVFYQRTCGNYGFKTGSLALGYFGVVDALYEYNVLPEALCGVEFTDKDGTRWIRTEDVPDGEGGWNKVYSVSIMESGKLAPESAILLMMRNADDLSEVKYFSFYPELSENGEFVFSDVHYQLDPAACDRWLLQTNYMQSVYDNVAVDRYGFFTMPVTFYPVADGEYYVLREMGNTQAQWLSGAEVFYYVNGSYQQLSEGVCACLLLEDTLYMHRGTTLHIYNDGQTIKELDVPEFSRMGGILEAFGGRYIAAGSDLDGMLIYDSQTGKDITVSSEGSTIDYSDRSLVVTLDGVEYSCTADGSSDTLMQLFE